MPDSDSPNDAPTAQTDAPTDAEAEAEADAPPLNRAERRAKGKASKQPPPLGKGPITGHQNRSGGPRQWSNRRGGGG